MPSVRIGDKLHSIPWDADAVTDLIFKGYEVKPDDGINPATYEFHQQEIEKRLRKKWGATNLRTGTPQEARHTPPQLPSITAGEDPLKSYPGGGVSRDALVNPYIKYEAGQIHRDDMIDIQNALNFPRNMKKPTDL